MTPLLRRLRYLFSRSRHDADLLEEIEAHRSLRRDALERDGMAPDDAELAGRRSLGNVALAVDEVRDVWTMRTIEGIWQDVREARRALLKSPGFALVAIGTLALGIGANTALLSIFSSLILRPLPVRDPGSLALLTNGSWSYPIWQQIQARAREVGEGVLAWSPQRFDLSPSGMSDPVDGAYVSGRLFDVLGVSATRGRMIMAADDTSAASDGAIAVISHRLWRQRYGEADDVIGRQLTIQRVPFTIVGVMPPGFFGLDVGRMVDVMLPFAAEPMIRGRESRLAGKGSWWLQIMVRLKPGQSLDHANAVLRAAQPQITEGAARTRIEPFTLAPAATGNSAVRRRFETPLFAMVIAVGLVLLVACANIASLLLARALARRHELSVRLALGSSRWRIARLLFVESALVTATGAVFGLAFAWWASALLVRQLSTWQNIVSLGSCFNWTRAIR